MIDGLPIGIIAPSTIAGLAVLLILTGRLVPRKTYDDKVHEANEWRAESRVKDAQIAEKDEQLRALAEVGRTINAVMRAIKQGASQDEVSG